MNTGISLICMSQGNPKVLKETFKSLWGVVDEIIFGDLLLFEDDRKIIENYTKEFNLKIIPYQFTYIFENGFSAILNSLISQASNEYCIYMNCSEVIEYGKENILHIIESNPECNTFYFDHGTDPHRWFRLAKKSELRWGGVIHESLGPSESFRPYHKPLFRMADLPKDNNDLLKSRCYDFCKEVVYFTNYKRIIDNPELLGNTDPGWISFAQANYESFIERLERKGDFYTAFINADLKMLFKYVYENKEFEKERLESSVFLEYQNDKKYLL